MENFRRDFNLANDVYNSIDIIDYKYATMYNKNDIVRHNGSIFISLIDNNSDVPDVSINWDPIN